MIYHYHNYLEHFPDCRLVALPFLCQYYFPLSDCTSGKICSASREDCVRISTTKCALPWMLAGDSSVKLPDCQSLQPTSKCAVVITVYN